ncbi:MAG: cysteine--tRNA ligase [bacterium]|nr:cysteine--tRNA ligase [bacterium]
MYLYNSLTRKKEEFVALNPQSVGMYTCGPTVYDYASIGNFRTYVTSDILRRVLTANGYQVKSVMNITDVGHLTGDNLGDADTGEDRIEKSAKKEGKTAWDIAKFYTDAYLTDAKKLNILSPHVLAKATGHIEEQIQLIKTLEEKGFTYQTSDGVYFETKVFEEKTGKRYGELSTLDRIKEGARVEKNPEKRNPRDFALWKFSPPEEKRQMEWESPWGMGFPGWHLECSAMSMKYLGESFDIHVGGEDLRQTHHPNEIAQSEGATGKTFVQIWIHAAFLTVDGKRMGKSLGNVYTVSDVEKKGFDPMSLRYLYLTSHYRDPLNFTWESLAGAQTALGRLRAQYLELSTQEERTVLSEEKQAKIDEFRAKFLAAVNDDLNTPQAIAVLWDTLKSNVPSPDKYDLLLYFDEVLGLDVGKVSKVPKVPKAVMELVGEREKARKAGDFKRADELRVAIKEMGYTVDDTEEGPKVK